MIILGYSIYILVSIFLIFWVGKKLHRDGSVWLASIFEEHSIGQRINDLLLLSYYVVNGGYAIYALSNWAMEIHPLLEAGRKTGLILLILSYLHYQNIFTIYFLHNYKILEKWKI